MLESDAAPAIDHLKTLLDPKEKDVAPFAAWAIYKADEPQFALDFMYRAIHADANNPALINIFDWMADAAKPVLDKYARGKVVKKGFLRDVIVRAGVDVLDETKATVVPRRQFVRAGGEAGLDVEYFAKLDCKGEVVGRDVHKNIYVNWRGEAPKPDMPKNGFSVRWTGQLQASESGVHLIVADFDGGGHVWLDGKHIVNSWRNKAAKVVLEANKSYTLKVEFSDKNGNAKANLRWLLPSAIPEALR